MPRTPGDDIRDWFDPAFTVRLAYTSGDRTGDLAGLWRCKVCAALLEGEWRAAHRLWHLAMAIEDGQR